MYIHAYRKMIAVKMAFVRFLRKRKRFWPPAVAVLGWGQGHRPPSLAQATPPIFRVIAVHKLLNLLSTGQLDTAVLLVVASQMMRGQAPKYFFLRTAPGFHLRIATVRAWPTVPLVSCYLRQKYERHPLIVRYHLSLSRIRHRHLVVPRQIVGVLHPAIARHELGVGAGEVYRCPACDWLVQVQYLPIKGKDIKMVTW